MTRFRYLPAPAHCPAPDPAFPHNEGLEIARVSRLMGKTLQPWQRLVVNRATQWRPAVNVRGQRVREYKYARVLVTVPRQSGKTTLMGPVQLHRMLLRPGSSALYTAQTGADAADRMKELIGEVMASPVGELFTPRFSTGSEGLTLPETGTTLTRFSPTLSSVHGGHPHLVTLDEVWKYDQTLGEGLLGAIGPSQVTIREEAQIWMISTKGTARSDFMNGLIRDGIEGSDPHLCYIEWSMPDGMDPYDPATWWAFHPALGNVTGEGALASDMTLSYAEWMRGYMNVVTAAENPLIPAEDWDRLAAAEDATAMPDLASGEVSLAYEASAAGESAAIVAGWLDPAGYQRCAVLRQGAGTQWLAPTLVDLLAAFPALDVVADDGGPTRRVTDLLAELTPEDAPRVRTLRMTDRAIADQNLMVAATETRQLRHDGSEALRVAVSNAVMRETNGAGRFDRDKSTAPIPSLIAASVALWGATHRRETFWTLP